MKPLPLVSSFVKTSVEEDHHTLKFKGHSTEGKLKLREMQRDVMGRQANR